MGQRPCRLDAGVVQELTNPRQLSSIAKGLYGSVGVKDRFLATYRPYLCPFGVVMEHVGEGSSVLDIGCGSGLWLFLLARSGRISEGTGFDVNRDKIELADSIKGDEDKLRFVHVDCGGEWPEGPFDCVTMIDVLHHIPLVEQFEFLSGIGRTGAKRIVFKDIDPGARFKSFMNTVHDVVVSRQVPRYCRRDQVAEWLEQMGYRVVENVRCDMLWYSHYLIVAEKD